jgi:hypothetical protein
LISVIKVGRKALASCTAAFKAGTPEFIVRMDGTTLGPWASHTANGFGPSGRVCVLGSDGFIGDGDRKPRVGTTIFSSAGGANPP